MDGLTKYQRGDAYLLSALSIFCVCLFIGVKFNALWWREKYLKGLLATWGVLELAVLILFSLENSRGIKLPWVLARSVHNLLVTMSLWGIATTQVTAIIYIFAEAVGQEAWWICTATLECVAVVSIVIFSLVRGDSIPIEVAYVIPLTSQVATVLVTAYTLYMIPSKKSSNQAPCHMVIHSMGISVAVIAASATAIALSATGNLPNLVSPYGILFMINSIVGYRPPESRQPSHHSEIALNSGGQPSLAPSLPSYSSLPQPC
ncbi:hypothetical protein B0T10DRAFT_551329 [Thelonectria olida]|uniref:Uncharacterized protein n=1 Tax=Thelonectria olida TaxID=1576542 RepID=A0A9P8VY70_9HYPO|nr:hypothetical protein B0T10DRAFT_551329 [Thelonectria olida]